MEKVFEFYRDFRNLPTFLGDVMAVELIGPTTSRWTIQGPLGIRVPWLIRVTQECTNELIRYETVAPPGLNPLDNSFRPWIPRGSNFVNIETRPRYPFMNSHPTRRAIPYRPSRHES